MTRGSRPVLALVPDRQDRARLSDAFHGRATLRFVGTVAEAMEALRTSTPGLVIVDLRDADGRSTLDVIRQVVAAAPNTAVVAYCSPGPEHSGAIREAALAGAHDLLFRGTDESGVAIRHVIASATHACASEILFSAVSKVLPGVLHRFARVVLASPTTVLSIDDAARELGVHRRTLVNQAQRAGLPPPSELLMWLRALLAAYYLTNTAQTVDSIASDLEFATPTALRHLLRRYVGLRATELRQRGGAPVVLEAMATRFGRWRSEHVLRRTSEPPTVELREA